MKHLPEEHTSCQTQNTSRYPYSIDKQHFVLFLCRCICIFRFFFENTNFRVQISLAPVLVHEVQSIARSARMCDIEICCLHNHQRLEYR